jgi:hypothetical protein
VDENEYDVGPPTSGAGRWQGMVNVAGAATSIALVIGIGVWGYQLAVRDVSGIPVVRALSGPMRVAPQEPGGVVAAHVGLSVNDIAAEGAATSLPEQMVLAPRPVELSLEDQPVEALAQVPEATLASLSADVSGEVTIEPLVPVLPVEEPTEATTDDISAPADLAPDAMEAAVAGALAEALAPEGEAVAIVEPAPPGAVLKSPRPERRPEGDGSEEILVPVALATTAMVSSGEVDAATLTPGTRLVQLGAFDDEVGARAEWERLRVKFGDIIAPKTLVLQTAQSGGRSFVRLRALGFDDEADARRFCSALLAEDAACIPVTYRP